MPTESVTDSRPPALGRRWRLKTYTKSGSAWVLDSEKLFVYDGYRQIAEFTMNGTTPVLTASYLWQPGLDGIILRATFGTVVRYFIPDGNRNIIQLRDASGTITDSYAYGPFGQCDAGGTTPNPFRFSCEYHDAETGLVYYNFRHYHPGLGRWTSRDPLEENELFYYAMTANNTISFFDCLGLKIPEIFYSPFNTLKKYHLPSPGILFGHNYWYGNWGGPGWAAGQDVHDGWNDPRLKGWKAPDREGNLKDVYIDYEKLAPSLKNPIDAVDACYKEHDLCYEKCREPYRCITKNFWGRITDVKEGDPSLVADCYTKCDFESVPCQLKALMHLSDTSVYAINNPSTQGIRLPIRALTAICGIIGLGGQGLVRKYMAPIGKWIHNQSRAATGAIGSAVESTWDWTQAHSEFGVVIHESDSRFETGSIGFGITIRF